MPAGRAADAAFHLLYGAPLNTSLFSQAAHFFYRGATICMGLLPNVRCMPLALPVRLQEYCFSNEARRIYQK
jgi:hypothetical protein